MIITFLPSYRHLVNEYVGWVLFICLENAAIYYSVLWSALYR